LEINDATIITHNMGAIGNPGKTWMDAMHEEEDA
jgi:hypothetical protein